MVIPKLGDVLLTHFGVCTVTKVYPIVNNERNDGVEAGKVGFFKCSLWRIPGKSVGSCSTAFLRWDSVSPMFGFLQTNLIFFSNICSMFCVYIL